MNHVPDPALLQYSAGAAPQQGPMYDMSQHHQHLAYQHVQGIPYPQQGPYPPQDANYMPSDAGYSNHVRVGSVPFQQAPEVQEDKRRKGSAVTATNDKELREMLAKNDGRPLRDVAQEVIAKERTPMAEKTKQLFAMLW